MDQTRTLGANLDQHGRCVFCVWAPFAQHMCLEVIPHAAQPYQIQLSSDEDGYYQITLDHIQPGDRYYYCFNQAKYPDPASDFQPEGIWGPSEIILREHPSTRWHPIELKDYIIYELHVGTYTHEGTFPAILPHLPELKKLGINAIELMPIAQFPGSRNWGYDGVFPFAVQNTYGGPKGLKAFVQSCHQLGMSVILDVVYNHLGPEGNNLNQFGYYFSNHYMTCWGNAFNLDGPYNHHVRRYFIENALHWFMEYDIDALRLDATHALTDMSAYPFLEELADKVALLSKQTQRPFYLILENDQRDLRPLRRKEHYGFGIDAMWSNDFHATLHAKLTQENHGIYQDFGTLDDIAKVYKNGFAHLGTYSKAHRSYLGSSSRPHSDQLILFLQNHDQIGNRACGERLTRMLSFEQIKLATSLLFCSPYIPLIFMGEEYGEIAPFLYFISHNDRTLIEAVRQGRQYAVTNFVSELPDPQAEKTFIQSKLNHALKTSPDHERYLNYFQKLIETRKKYFNLHTLSHDSVALITSSDQKLLKIELDDKTQRHHLIILSNFSDDFYDFTSYFSTKNWSLVLRSTDENSVTANHDPQSGGADSMLAPYEFLLFVRDINHDKS